MWAFGWDRSAGIGEACHRYVVRPAHQGVDVPVGSDGGRVRDLEVLVGQGEDRLSQVEAFGVGEMNRLVDLVGAASSMLILSSANPPSGLTSNRSRPHGGAAGDNVDLDGPGA